jgi:mono/diheme cytochrome c family protein
MHPHRLLFVAAVLVLRTVPGGAQDSSVTAATLATIASFYTPEQAARGEKTYRARCTRCHAPTAYTGEEFTRVWEARTAFELFDLLSTTMPDDAPGALKPEEYVDVVAYIFRLNGLPAGKQPLPVDPEALKQVRIERRVPPA